MRRALGYVMLGMGIGFLAYGASINRTDPILVGMALVGVGAFVAFYRIGR